MLIFVKLLAPVFIGGATAAAVTFGAVQVQTSPPDSNPASTEIITYGDQS